MTPNFFARPAYNIDQIRSNWFFLMHHGKGYDLPGLKEMTFEELTWHANKLNKQLKAEREHYEDQVRAQQSRAKGRKKR